MTIKKLAALRVEANKKRTRIKAELNNGTIYTHTKVAMIGPGTRIAYNVNKQTFSVQHPDTLKPRLTGHATLGFDTDSNFKPIWVEGEKTTGITKRQFFRDYSVNLTSAFVAVCPEAADQISQAA